ncbi:MAG: GNAT family N-acetyltransferase [Candidatus Heimdallarchaeota archaeon]|nr:GNAT family N-acetyltransferase [Candidatus Heimdallarchaeota archaeon]
MNKTKIIKCQKENIPFFTYIMDESFSDKYPKFFSGVDKEVYLRILNQQNSLELEKSIFSGKFLIRYNHEIAGAIEFYVNRKEMFFLKTFKILIENIGGIKALKIYFMLLGFGPPVNFPKRTLFIDKIGVLKKYQGKGLGTKLMRFAIDFARKLKYDYLILEVISRNKKAISLYHKLGFKIIRKVNTRLGQAFVGVDSYYIMRKTMKSYYP